MSHQKQLERVLDLLLSENVEKAAEVHHQIIVEMARKIYEEIVDGEESEDDEVGGDASEDFTDEIESDESEIESDEENDGEIDDEDLDDDFGDEEGEGDVEDRVEDLEDQLEELRAEFDALMGEEMQEPNHADLADQMDGDDDMDMGDDEFPASDDDQDKPMFEKRRTAKLEKAPEAKDRKRGKKVDEETQFLTKVADTGQRGTAKYVGTGKGATLGAENTKSPYTSVPARKDYGGKPTKIGGDGGTGGEYGKYKGEKAKDGTPSDNTKVVPKKSSLKADSTAKYTGGKAAGDKSAKSPIGS